MQCLVFFHFHPLHPLRHPLAPSRVVEASEGHVEESVVNQWQDLTPNFALAVWVWRFTEPNPNPNSQSFHSFEISCWQGLQSTGFKTWFIKCQSSCLRKAYARWRSMMLSDGFKRSTTAKLHSKSWNTKTGKFNALYERTAHQLLFWENSSMDLSTHPSTYLYLPIKVSVYRSICSVHLNIYTHTM